ncbi:MAG: glycosyltransferase family 4 protein [Bacteroidaceae bacterium]|nr:glycosyltransferase family 4 protein [Bacteroidaceae bacterium]
MKVLLINTSERTGGAAIAAGRLMEALKKQGVRAKMLVRDKQTDRLTVVAIKANWKLPVKFLWERVVIFLANRLSRRNLFQMDIANVGTDITRMHEFRNADVIHLHWVNQGFLSMKNIERIVKSGKPVVVTLHDQWFFTGICHYSADCQMYRERCQRCPLLAGGDGLWDLAGRVFDQKRRIYGEGKITFVGCSRWMAELARKSALTQGHRVVSIPNTIDMELFRPEDRATLRQKHGIPTNRKLILFGAQRITDERKGFHYLEEACRQIAMRNPQLAEEIEILVVGGDAAKVQNRLPFKVKLVNYVSEPQQMVELYNMVNIYVTPSLQDNLPNTIVEAMACGIPCVGFNVGGIPEMIDHKQNGYVAAYRDSGDFARGIEWTLTADFEELSLAARQKAEATYSEEAVAKMYMEVYEELLKIEN